MSVYELMALIGLVVGPVSAVVITLWSQSRKAVRDSQLQTVRMLVNTRHLVADPSYSIAINMVLIDFNKVPSVISVWDQYMSAVFHRPDENNRERHEGNMHALQTKLIHAMLRHLGFSVSETDLQRNAYAAQSFIDRDNLNIQSQVACMRIANALEEQNRAAGFPQPVSAEDLVPEQKPIEQGSSI